jgi:transposase InsO family protein
MRKTRRRCAQVIHAQLLREGISVSLSTVCRTLKRRGLIIPRSSHKKYHFSGERPRAEKPGFLVETDTIHIYLDSKKRVYIFTLIDCFSRWAYARASTRLSARLALEFIREARGHAPFTFQCMQSDHGSEFSPRFTVPLQADGMRHRHIRVRKPNDNAHIERFNRTIQEDMQKEISQYKNNLPLLNREIEKYLDYYNNQRLHMGINFQTPSEVLQRS